MLVIELKENAITKQELVFRRKENAGKLEDVIVSADNEDIHIKVV